MKKVILVFVISLFFSCNESQKSLDVEIQKLREADLNWAKAYESKDINRMIACYDKEAFFVQKEPVRGVENLTVFWKNIFSMPEYHLTWEAEDVRISDDGDLGFTSGIWLQQYMQNGELIKKSDRYLAVWHKQPDGSWKVLVDKP